MEEKNKEKFLCSWEMTEEEMKIFSQEIAQRVKIFPEGGQVIFLSGDVGAGKTTFSRFFGEELGIKNISSPTFSLLSRYEGTGLLHADFYRADIVRVEEVMEEELQITNDVEAISNRPEIQQKIFLLEWFPNELIQEFFGDVPKIFLHFEHGENSSTRKISLRFENPWSVDTCEAKKMLEIFKTPVHVQRHIELVRTIAVKIGKILLSRKIPVDLNLIEASAILHDCVRYVDFPSFTPEDFKRYREEITEEKIHFWKKLRKTFLKKHHAQAMADILMGDFTSLEKQKFPATAKVVLAHMTGQIYRKEKFSWEEKSVYYADKRSLHDTFVSIAERLEDGRKRYAHEKNPGLEEKIFSLEEDLLKGEILEIYSTTSS